MISNSILGLLSLSDLQNITLAMFNRHLDTYTLGSEVWDPQIKEPETIGRVGMSNDKYLE